MTLDEPGSADQVTAFYQAAFQNTPYELDGYEVATGTVSFTRARRGVGQASGYLTIEGHGARSTVEVEISTP